MSRSTRLGISLLILVVCQCGLAAGEQWKDRPLREYIAWLASQNISVIYSSDLVRPDFTVREEPADGADSVAALRGMLLPYGLSLTSGPAGSLLVTVKDDAQAELLLTVTDRDSGTGIAGAVLQLDGSRQGRTDERGELRYVSPRPASAVLKVQADGYFDSVPMQIELHRHETLSIALSLRPRQLPLPEIIVTSSHYRLKYEPSGSPTFLDRELTTGLPDVGDDAVRSIDRLPGTANGGVSTRTHVRGGISNEQLFLFDGLRLYEPFHLKDFHALTTTVDPNAVADIKFYSAGYQARYGDRMSGVIDMSLRQPEPEPVTELGLSFFHTSFLSMGRFGGSDRGDWLVTARRGNLDLVADVINPNYGAPRYQDAMLHLGFELSDRTYLSGNTLLSFDKISIAELDGSETANAKYRNRVAWIKAETDWNSALSSSTILSYTQIDNSRSGSMNVTDIANGSVSETKKFRSAVLKQDWQWTNSDKWLLTGGYEIKHLTAEYEYDSSLDIFSPFDQILDNQPSITRDIATTPRGAQYAAYIEARWQPFAKLITDIGIRWDQQTYTTANNDDQTSPRFNLLYLLSDNTELRLSFGQYYQAQEINELQVTDGDINYFPAQRATHVVGSISHELSDNIDLRLEVYEKSYHSLMPRFENVFDSLVLIPELQIDRVRIDANNAVSRGAEIMLTSEISRDNRFWWLSYSWSSIVDSLADGDVKRGWDQTHAVTAGVSWNWGQWDFSVAGAAHTGWPRTELSIENVSNPDGSISVVASTSPRNSLRHPVFHTLDARVSRQFDLAKVDLTTFLEVTNLYNRRNTCCVQYQLGTDLGGNRLLTRNEGNWLPLIPSLGVILRF